MALNIYHTKKLNSLHPIIARCSEKLIFDYPYYSDIIMGTNFHESEQVPTCGVNCSTRGFNFYYNKKFIESLPNDATMMFIVIHEIFHLLFSHPSRTRSGGYEPQLSNVAQDMIINTIIKKDICTKEGVEYIDIPFEMIKGKRRNNCLFIPKEYPGDHVFEKLYDWLLKEKSKREKQRDKENYKKEQEKNKQKNKQQGQSGSPMPKQNGQKQESNSGEKEESESGKENGEKNGDQNSGGSGNNQEKNEDGNGNSGRPDDKHYGENGINKEECYDLETTLDNLIDGEEAQKKIQMTVDEHLDDEVPKELRDQMVKDVIQRIRARGFASGDFEETLKKLRKSRKDYLKDIKRGISEIKGNHKIGTWKRANRKGLPLKGIKRSANVINMILDTSGSMHGYYEKALSYVFQNSIQINAIQIDTKCYDLGPVKSKYELAKMAIHGGGGTVLQPAVDLVREKYNQYNTVVLTDGATDSLNFTGVKGKVLIISVETECPIARSNGKLKQVVVNDD